MRISRRSSVRRGIAGIIGAVILFSLLFTIGTEYFIFVNNANNLETQSLVTRGNSIVSGLQENMFITTSLSSAGYVQFYLNNTGGQAINVTSLILLSSSGGILECDGVGLPSGQGCVNNAPVLPVIANVGKGAPLAGFGWAVTSYHYVSGTVTLELFTSNGNVFSATYPLTGVSLAAQALSSGAIGDLYLAFQSYYYYTVTSGGGCPTGAPYSGYCLNLQGKAFSINSANTGPNYNVAFSIRITDLNQQHSNIVLDPYTLMSLVPESGRGSLSYTNWFIISNLTVSGYRTILSAYTPLVLTYGVPVSVVFAASAPQTSGINFGISYLQATGTIAAGTTTPVFMVSHGCEGSGITTCTASASNYGQNSPYVTTLFY